MHLFKAALWFVLQVATCSSCITTRSQFCLLLEDGGSSLSSLSHLALDSSAHCFLLICIAARQQLVKSFFSFLMLLLVSCLPWVVLPWLLCLLCTASTSATSWAAVLLLLFGIVLMHSVICVFSSFFVLLTYPSFPCHVCSCHSLAAEILLPLLLSPCVH